MSKVDNLVEGIPVTSVLFNYPVQELQFDVLPSVSGLELSKAAFDDVTYTSSPLQAVPTKLLKSMKSMLLPILLYVFNLSFTSGTYPKCLKVGTVIPLLKKTNADPEVFKNYRPVTNIHFFAKVLKKLVSKCFTIFLRKVTMLSILFSQLTESFIQQRPSCCALRMMSFVHMSRRSLWFLSLST